jgi:hypothetical protein
MYNIEMDSSHEKIMMSLPGSQAVNQAYKRGGDFRGREWGYSRDIVWKIRAVSEQRDREVRDTGKCRWKL